MSIVASPVVVAATYYVPMAEALGVAIGAMLRWFGRTFKARLRLPIGGKKPAKWAVERSAKWSEAPRRGRRGGTRRSVGC